MEASKQAVTATAAAIPPANVTTTDNADSGDGFTINGATVVAEHVSVSEPFQVCVLTATKPERLAKRIELDADGQPVKLTGGQLLEGAGKIRGFTSLEDFAAFLETLKPNQALTYGVPRGGDGPIVARKNLEHAPAGAQVRTKETFGWPKGAGIFMVDYDHHGDGQPLTRDELHARIVQAMPELAQVQMLWRPSGSSCVYRKSDDSEVFGVNGQRLYFIVDDAARIEDIGRALFARLWLAGHGRIEISASGAMLLRTDVDNSVWESNRLDFAGGAEMGPRLYQKRGGCVLMGGDARRLQAASVPELTAQEHEDYGRLVATKKQAIATNVSNARAAFLDANSPAQAERRGIPEPQARSLMAAVLDGAPLDADWLLYLSDGQEVTVRQCLKDPEKYHGMYCRDPVAPREDQPQVGWLRLLGDAPAIYTHKTDTWYPLRIARTVLTLVNANMNDAVDDVARVLAKSGRYFRQDERIVAVNPEGDVVGLQDEALLQAIDEQCEFRQYKRTGRGENLDWASVQVRCPDTLGRRLTAMAKGGQANLPKLAGVSKNPILTADGVIVEDPGYHARSETLIINTSGKHWEPIPRNPSRADVVRAFQVLWAPFQLFPCADDQARSVLLAAILTAVVRPTLDLAPGFMFTAPMAGTGKTRLAEAVGAVAGGSKTSRVSGVKAEFDKLITSLLVQGLGCYILDNVSGTVGTEQFDALLTSPTAQSRVLGKSETISGHRTLWLITGNNARLHGDTNRRILTCRLDAKTDQVVTRRFPFDPLEKARAERLAVVRAALTVLVAWRQTDEYKTTTAGSFPAWSRGVAGAVGWLGRVLREEGAELRDGDDEPLGFVDPAPLLQDQLLNSDDDRYAWGAFLAAWYDMEAKEKAFEPMTARSAYEILEKSRAARARGNETQNARAFFAHTLEDTSDRPLMNARMVGKLFASMVDVPVRGLQLVKQGMGTGANSGTWYWAVHKA